MTPNPQVENHQDAQDSSSLRARRRAERRLAACSSSGASPSAAAPSAAPPSAAPSAAPSRGVRGRPPARPRPRRLSLGKILVDGEGMTLYMFTPDEAGTPTCYDDCATNWPALSRTAPRRPGRASTRPLTTSTARTAASRSSPASTRCTTSPPTRHPVTPTARAGDSWYVVGADGEPIKARNRHRRCWRRPFGVP